MKNKGRLAAFIIIPSLLVIAAGILVIYINRNPIGKQPLSSTSTVLSGPEATSLVSTEGWQRQVTKMEHVTVSVLLPSGMEMREEDHNSNYRIYLIHDELPEEYRDMFASFELSCGWAGSFAPVSHEEFMAEVPTIKAGEILEEDIVFTLAENLEFSPWTYRHADNYRLENHGNLGVAYGNSLVAVYPDGFAMEFVIDMNLSDTEFQRRRELLETIFAEVELL